MPQNPQAPRRVIDLVWENRHSNYAKNKTDRIRCSRALLRARIWTGVHSRKGNIPDNDHRAVVISLTLPRLNLPRISRFLAIFKLVNFIYAPPVDEIHIRETRAVAILCARFRSLLLTLNLEISRRQISHATSTQR